MAQPTSDIPEPTVGLGIPSGPKTYDLDKPILTLANGLTIRCHRHSDAATLAKHCNNHKIARTMSTTWPYPYSIDSSHDWIALQRNQSNWRATGPTDPKSNNSSGMGQKLPTAWVVAKDDVPIGGVGVILQSNHHARTAPFGYWLAEEYWRQGIMSVVVPAYIEWLWETYPWLVKLEPGVYGWNPASARLLEKCGFELEGRLRASIQRFGVLGDLLVYGLMRKGVEVTGEAPE